MTARDHILGRIRRSTQGHADMPPPLRPTLATPTGEIAIEQFITKAQKVDATVSRIASLDELPVALGEELRRRNLPAAIRTGADPAFARDWGGIEHTTGPGRIEEPAAMTRAEFGMAETGSLVFASGPDNPVTLNFLGETHFAVVHARDIIGGYEDLWAAWRQRGLTPRTTNFITGPSRSADIGQTLQLGAHGPVALHVFVVGEAGRSA
ncbi:MAG TPA: lactate utilization protein [Paracoccaceae bacterium]|nr:lactate utilization protein [Paracoccaceae bacterium]